MPNARFKGVQLCSSEDKNYPANNLVANSANSVNKKWKCEETGLDSAYVVLQLEKSTRITGIDIGNEHSAFVEVEVGRTGWSIEKFKTILVASSLMTVIESRVSENPNRVRCFKKDALMPDIANEKWDLVKVTCIQSFNKHVQFGLSFITIHTPDAIPTDCELTVAANPKEKTKCDETLNLPKTNVFSQFRMRTESSDSDDKGSEYSLFLKWKQENSTVNDTSNGKHNLSVAAAIRDASSSVSKLEQCTKINHKIETPTGKAKRSIDASEKDGKKERINRNRPAIMYDDEDENTSNPKLEKLINDDKERIERERKLNEMKGKKNTSRDEKSKKKMEQSFDKFKTILQADVQDKTSHSTKVSSTKTVDADDMDNNVIDDNDDDDVYEVKQKPAEKVEISDSDTDDEVVPKKKPPVKVAPINSSDTDEEVVSKKKSPVKVVPVSPARSQSSDPSTPPAWKVKNKRPSTSNHGSASKRSRNSQSPKAVESDDEMDGILCGVVFVISGIQNPDRAEMRDKALEMGAKYKPDWNNSCTHLISAFKNTPKYKQVKGSGIIVNTDWIGDCYAQKKKLPWQDYQL